MRNDLLGSVRLNVFVSHFDSLTHHSRFQKMIAPTHNGLVLVLLPIIFCPSILSGTDNAGRLACIEVEVAG